ncbi:MAG: permease prefix domain 1-containing protein [Pseudoflavonifractor sp.]
MPDDLFAPFCAAVCAKVRYRPARPAIAAELRGHLEDHAQALAATGVPPDAAEAQAVAAMGDPLTLGAALDCAHPPLLTLSVLLTKLLAICLVTVAALILVPSLFVSVRNFCYHEPPSETAVRRSAAAARLNVDRETYWFTDAELTAEGTLKLRCLSYAFPPAIVPGATEFTVEDHQGGLHDFGGNASSSSFLGLALYTFHGFPTDCPYVILHYTRPGRETSVTIPLEEVSAP